MIEGQANAGVVPGLHVDRVRRLGTEAYGRPSLTIQHLPRCHCCGAAHPAAGYPLPDTVAAKHSYDCAGCGTRLPALPASQEVIPVLTGRDPPIIIARALLAAGRLCARLKRRLRP